MNENEPRLIKSFLTASFKAHNLSKSKQAKLLYAMRAYTLTVKRIVEELALLPDLQEQTLSVSETGRARVLRHEVSRLANVLAPKGWCLAPIRDYVVGDATAAIASYLALLIAQGERPSPPTIAPLSPPSSEEMDTVYGEIQSMFENPLDERHLQIIEQCQSDGHHRKAERLRRTFQSWTDTKRLAVLLRSLEPPLPRPIEFTRCEPGRGFLLVEHNGRFYVQLRIFSPGHPKSDSHEFDHTFRNWKSQEPLAPEGSSRSYHGILLPIEIGRDFHESKFLTYGTPQSAKLLCRPTQSGNLEFFINVSFRFDVPEVKTSRFIGIDRGYRKIGTASVVDEQGGLVCRLGDLDGISFYAALNQHEQKIQQLQQRGIQRHPRFRIRRNFERIVLGEFTNRLIDAAITHSAKIVIEKIDAKSMNRFIRRSQFAKLKDLLVYKCRATGLPDPIEVPAAYSSQTCAQCGHCAKENRPKFDSNGRPIQHQFQCTRCGHTANADENASEVLALRALHQLQAGDGRRFQKFAHFQQWLQQLRTRYHDERLKK